MADRGFKDGTPITGYVTLTCASCGKTVDVAMGRRKNDEGRAVNLHQPTNCPHCGERLVIADSDFEKLDER
jgi:DNA-directed RNA polymerase subunit RPC12/RpoP